ncbi:hypothetical protein F442_23110 [Phytophthora nicotianae P10297]|uniref:TIR domain-containing protein n=1 Tax=Phytophthora nicotianae P10297 TaxID=1317064 RepID=W2XYZ5_PHYNI|nr:hypothetical protein F442_23110 [Phytophthora nicotianae P10297]
MPAGHAAAVPASESNGVCSRAACTSSTPPSSTTEACYSDRNISGQEVALETILRCSCFVVLVSKQMMSSELVRDPLAFAEDKGRPIVPVELNDLSLGLYKSYSLVPVPFTGVWN